jgi:hypothetical protein
LKRNTSSYRQSISRSMATLSPAIASESLMLFQAMASSL